MGLATSFLSVSAVMLTLAFVVSPRDLRAGEISQATPTVHSAESYLSRKLILGQIDPRAATLRPFAKREVAVRDGIIVLNWPFLGSVPLPAILFLCKPYNQMHQPKHMLPMLTFGSRVYELHGVQYLRAIAFQWTCGPFDWAILL
ncbi:hypothetical protein B0H19DRAFT_1073243 [Mycena capillaripes]|nr:hypothetical protein B0H19DRAFT_1073243 [Mycena capillaripes]